MAIKRGLGKGLSALLPTEEEETRPSGRSKSGSGTEAVSGGSVPGSAGGGPAGFSGGSVQGRSVPGSAGNSGGEISISLDKIKANPGQPRKNFDEKELAELADSIKQQGIIVPPIVEEAEDGNYIIVAGERRVRAAKLAGLKKVPVIIRKYSDEKRLVVSLIENIQRTDLNPMEEASAFRQLMEMEKLSQDEVATRVSKNRATVANTLRLLKLPPAIQESVSKKEISPGHAMAILSMTTTKAQEILFKEILKKGLTVREAEKRAAVLGGQSRKSKKTPVKARKAPEIEAMTEKFITRLGTKVVINGDLKKGTILIDYYSMEDLDRLYEILSG